MVTHEIVKEVLKIYSKAWMNKDPEEIITIFTEDATYHERAFEEPHKGHEEIKKYWRDIVIGEQTEIEFELLNLYIEGDTAIAEWKAKFHKNNSQKKKVIKEVAILEFEGNKIKSLREYWHSKEE
jgi:ketosteroid isomerase-like protein